jgi:C-terminal processing protease CtpA/Prc
MRSSVRHFVAFIVAVVLTTSLAAGAELTQTQRLAGLCRVWGLLKYYHNNVASGQLNWNQKLMEAIPGIKAASDPKLYEHALLQLVRQAGYGETSQFPKPKSDFVNIDWQWLDKAGYSTPLLSVVLKAIRDGRNTARQFYYSPVFSAGNLQFLEDKKLSTLTWEREEVRLLTLFCYWNIIEYFFPYKNLMDHAWEETLFDFIPKFQNAPDELSYHMAVKELGAMLNDSHGIVSSSIISNDWSGTYTIGFEPSYIEGRTVVTRVYPRLLGSSDIRVGDIITHVNGKSCEALRAEKRKYIQASNEPTLQRNLNRPLFAGQSPFLQLTIDREGQTLQLLVPGVTYTDYYNESDAFANAIVPALILEGNIGYIHMGALKPEQIASTMSMLQNTQAIIFDVRNYPQGTIWEINRYLNESTRPWAKFNYPLVESPGYFGSITISTEPSTPNPAHYKGRIIILANELTQSQAEYTCMALQATGRSTLIGSQTAGADGNVSYVYLPGYITAVFTGLGTYYPDGRQTQRIGIVPDIVIQPTIAGIRAGRDEVRERALQFIAMGI